MVTRYRSGLLALTVSACAFLVMAGTPAHSQAGQAAAGPTASGTWQITGNMTATRMVHTATLLPNGQVLVAGGAIPSVAILASAELYNPATATWTATGSMNGARDYHTATLLPSGKVLVAGGAGTNITAEVYDPSAGTWTVTGSMIGGRYLHTATLLSNGKVLVVGGLYGSGALAYSLSSVELYDPSSGKWTPTGSLAAARGVHTATLLANGKVLVTGGCYGKRCRYNLASSEVYDPATGTWTTTGSMSAARVAHVAALLPSGQVLVAGGDGGLGTAELYNPATGTWATTGRMSTDRRYATATLLGTGKVLVAGGQPGLTSAELYDPSTGTWSPTGNMNAGRYEYTATLLASGQVLAAGGSNTSTAGSLASAEVYSP